MIIRDEVRRSFPFLTPRDNQLEAVEEAVQAMEKGFKYIVIEASTGAGKSVMAVTQAIYDSMHLNHKVYIVNKEKTLQDQYEHDFNRIPNMAILKGRGSYPCTELSEGNYLDGICHQMTPENRKILPCNNTCPYKVARRRAKEAKITNINYAYLLADFTHNREEFRIGDRDLIIFDEAHNLEGILFSYAKVSVSQKDIDKIIKNITQAVEILGFVPPVSIDEFTAIFNSFKTLRDDEGNMKQIITLLLPFYKACEKTSKEMHKLTGSTSEEDEDDPDDSIDFMEKLQKVLQEKLYKSFDNFISYLDTNMKTIEGMIDSLKAGDRWVPYRDDVNEEFVLKPTHAINTFKNTFQKMGETFIFMSATPPSAKILSTTIGVPENEIYTISLPCLFPIENRPVYALNSISLSYREIDGNLPILVRLIDKILENHQGENILLHTGSYKINKYLGENSRHVNRMIVSNSKTRLDDIETFKHSKNTVLLSPSVMEGIDLVDDICRVQVIVKVPYLSLADKQIKVRTDIEPMWYSAQAITSIVQAAGRAVRNDKDYAITYVLDKEFNKLSRNYSSLFPKWFLEAVKYSTLDVALKHQFILQET